MITSLKPFTGTLRGTLLHLDDRLDLGRVGITPHPSRLCTAAAKRPETIRWADSRAIFRKRRYETANGLAFDVQRYLNERMKYAHIAR